MEEIVHKGKVVSISPQSMTVEIISESACSACHAKSLCSMSEYTTKAVEIPSSAWVTYEPGEEVEVVLKSTMGHKAVWLAYVIPLLVLMAVLLGCLAVGASELLAGLLAIAATALYYLVIWLFRDRLRKEYVFQARKIQTPIDTETN